MGYERRHNEGLVMFFLRSRRRERYGAVRPDDLMPGDPLFEAVRRRVAEAEEAANGGESMLKTIDRVLEQMRHRREANAQVLIETAPPTDEGPD